MKGSIMDRENFNSLLMMKQHTKHSSENQLAQSIRRSLFVELAHKDLPGFLLLEIEAILGWLNYFKISNLRDNKYQFSHYLDVLITRYHKDLWTSIANSHANKPLDDTTIEEFLTQELLDTNTQFFMTKQELHKIKSALAVQCTIQVKEFIYRHTTRPQTLKQTLA
jgi:hypothetical protein